MSRRSLSPAAALLLLWSAGALAVANGDAPRYELTVHLDPQTRRLEGEATLDLPAGTKSIVLSKRFAIESVVVASRPQAAKPAEQGRLQAIVVPAGARRMTVRWSGELAPLDATLDYRQVLGRMEPYASAEGSFLPAGAAWYPQVPERLASYRLTLELPAGQRGLVPGRLVEETEGGGRYRAGFEFARPAEGIDLMVGPYRVQERAFAARGGRPIAVRTYFHPRVADLAPAYLDALAGYFELYERWIGEYPFDSFSVVSSPLPTGFGMPALTYLGENVLRLPFIRETSLGHEVLHNWWGNGVYPDYRRGNWSEGLTTFMADYAYRERRGEEQARAMRLGWLRDITAITPGEDFPIGEFASRSHGTSQIVGYNKVAMVFLMLRDAIGRDAFDEGVRAFYREQRFRTAGWTELRRAFERSSGRNLEPQFAQWIERRGAPDIVLAAATAARDGDKHAVTVRIEQAGAPFRVSVPVRVITDEGTVTRTIELSGESAQQTIALAGRARLVELDPEFQVLRRLAPKEAPPILREAMIDPGATYLVLDDDPQWQSAAQRLSAALLDAAPRALGRDAPLPGESVVVFGSHGAIERWLAAKGLPPRREELQGKGSGEAWVVGRVGMKPILLVSARDAQALSMLERPLPHYGRESYVSFDGARAGERGVWPAQPQRIAVE
jgi:aminopeptidase N